MKVFCLGGAGKICREAILDLVQFSSFETITVADFNEEEGLEVVEWLNDPRVNFVKVDVTNHEDTVAKMKGYSELAVEAQLTIKKVNKIILQRKDKYLLLDWEKHVKSAKKFVVKRKFDIAIPLLEEIVVLAVKSGFDKISVEAESALAKIVKLRDFLQDNPDFKFEKGLKAKGREKNKDIKARFNTEVRTTEC